MYFCISVYFQKLTVRHPSAGEVGSWGGVGCTPKQQAQSRGMGGNIPSEAQKYRNTFAIKLLHKAYNQHQGAHPTPAHAQCRTAHRLSAGVR